MVDSIPTEQALELAARLEDAELLDWKRDADAAEVIRTLVAERDAQAKLLVQRTAAWKVAQGTTKKLLHAAESKLAIAEKTIQDLGKTGGLPIDQVWQRWRKIFTDYDAAKEAI